MEDRSAAVVVVTVVGNEHIYPDCDLPGTTQGAAPCWFGFPAAAACCGIAAGEHQTWISPAAFF